MKIIHGNKPRKKTYSPPQVPVAWGERQNHLGFNYICIWMVLCVFAHQIQQSILYSIHRIQVSVKCTLCFRVNFQCKKSRKRAFKNTISLSEGTVLMLTLIWRRMAIMTCIALGFNDLNVKHLVNNSLVPVGGKT